MSQGKAILILGCDPQQQVFFHNTVQVKGGYPVIVAATGEECVGLVREGRIGVALICCGGNPAALRERVLKLRGLAGGDLLAILGGCAGLAPEQATVAHARAIGADQLVPLPVFSDLLLRLLAELYQLHEQRVAIAAQRRQEGEQARAVEERRRNRAELPPKYGELLGDPPLTKQEYEFITPARLKTIMEVSELLDRLDYYQTLGVERETDKSAIKRRYFELAKLFHPDLFHHIDQPELRKRVYECFKRMTEAYHVLSDPDKRKAYEYNLSTKRTRETLRYMDRGKDVKAAGPQPLSAKVMDPQARKFYQLALANLKDGNLKSAKMNVQFALQIASGNEELNKLIRQIDEKLKGG